MNIKNIIGASIVSGIALVASSCKSTEPRYTESWLKSNRMGLYNNIMKNRLQSPLRVCDNKSIPEIQHEIDCITFQDIFTGNQIAKNSEFISDYNEMLKETQVERNYFNKVSSKSIDKKLEDILTGQEIKSLNSFITKNKCTEFIQARKQYLIDSVYHHNLFKKYNLLGGSNAKTFQVFCNKIKP